MSSDNEQIALAVTPAPSAGRPDAAPPPLTDAQLAQIAARAAELEAACAAWNADHWGGSAGARYWSAMFESGRDVRALLPEVDRLRAELAAELRSARAAIQGVLGNGADEEAWPPGTPYWEALGAHVGRLEGELDVLTGRLRAARAERDGARVEIGRLRAEIGRLRAEIGRLRAEIGRLGHGIDACMSAHARLRGRLVERGQEAAGLRAELDAARALLAELVRANRDDDSPEQFIVEAEDIALRAAALLTPESSPEAPR